MSLYRNTNPRNTNLQLNTVGAEGLDVRVVQEGNPVQIDDPEIRRGLLQGLNVEDFVDLALLLLAPFVGAHDVQHLHAVDEAVDPLHEVVQENHLAQADAHELEFGRECA